MVLGKEDFFARIQSLVGEDTSEESIRLIEDFTDTFNDFEVRTADSTNWETKYKENDESWRRKYKERFFETPSTSGGEVVQEQKEDVIDDGEEVSFEDLFEEREG